MTTREGTERLNREFVDWSDLRTFYAVATAGSMNAAAELMGVTQSAISKRLGQLELRLGARLLERSPAGIQLTEAGAEALDHVTTMMRASQSLENTLRGRETKTEGEVKIWANDGVLAYCITPNMGAFLSENPGLRLSLLSDRNLPKQGQGYADVVVGFDQPRQAEVISFPVATLHYCAFSSRDYIATYGSPSGLLDVAHHRVLNHTHYTENAGWKDKTAQIAGLIEPAIMTDCSASLLNAAAAGAGIAVMPSYASRLDSRLVALPIPPLASVKVWLSFHESARRVPRIRTVVSWMRNNFDRRKNPWFRDEFVPPNLFDAPSTAAWVEDKVVA
ncbi:MAG: LysR family transcriptional regulator [Alphaproteobacteria bacterium]|jgi:DNA-binding transcriptional LysR family regulator|nr:MAG: LysR family transcriptional regulator [Alphaproteobacteria bacterium]